MKRNTSTRTSGWAEHVAQLTSGVPAGAVRVRNIAGAEVKRSKMGNVRVVLETGEKFDSKAEHVRWVELKRRERLGLISELQTQVKFVLVPGAVIVTPEGSRKKPPIRYVADFQYRVGDQVIVEDVKGFKTAMYKIKQHMMKSLLGIDIIEIS